MNELKRDWNLELPAKTDAPLWLDGSLCLADFDATRRLSLERVHSAEDFAEAIENHGRTYVALNLGLLLNSAGFYDAGEANGLAELSNLKRSTETGEVQSFHVAWKWGDFEASASQVWSACVGKVCQLVPAE